MNFYKQSPLKQEKRSSIALQTSFDDNEVHVRALYFKLNTDSMTSFQQQQSTTDAVTIGPWDSSKKFLNPVSKAKPMLPTCVQEPLRCKTKVDTKRPRYKLKIPTEPTQGEYLKSHRSVDPSPVERIIRQHFSQDNQSTKIEFIQPQKASSRFSSALKQRVTQGSKKQLCQYKTTTTSLRKTDSSQLIKIRNLYKIPLLFSHSIGMFK